MLIKRTAQLTLTKMSAGFPVLTVTGPRQAGKSTLVKTTFPNKEYVTFDNLDVLESAKNDPRGFLARFPQGAVIDEAQRFPELFSYIKVIVDETKKPGLFVLTGSQQFGLVSSITESLAGRTGIVELLPFSIKELQDDDRLPSLNEILFKGLYPPLYDKKLSSNQWFAGYVTTYIERDVRNMLNIRELNTFQRFLRMCAARTGQLLNLSALANDCGISTPTARNWISVLEASYIIYLLQPHFSNFGKRLVKMPKIYFHDTGLACWLLNIQDTGHLALHPSRSALFENLVINDMLKTRYNHGLKSNLYFWRNNLGDEIDVLVDNGAQQIPVEIKSGQTLSDDYFKTLNKWKKITGKETNSYLIYAGNETHTRQSIKAVPWRSIPEI
ncbi:MAG: AAA family ATPase [Elusimicrobia bacterium RIFOXYA2_FULL_39_19]|nr:MAG: AAA family ATPase [Elusimicrobia bacterium RIFOXYA2_FULL_39_19]